MDASTQTAPPAAQTYDQLIPNLLQALHWRGNKRDLADAQPTGRHTKDIEEFRNVMAHLGYNSFLRQGRPTEIANDQLPLVYVDDDEIGHLITTQHEAEALPNKDATFVLFKSWPHTLHEANVQTPLKIQLRRFRPLLGEIFFFSGIIGMISLAPILYNQAIYDNIIASGSSAGIPLILGGALLALGAEMTLRHIRSRKLAFFGGRVDHFVSLSVFERLLYLPPQFTERASVSAQLARLRDFENVREFFTGPLATLMFELPLIILYLAVMVVMTQWLVLVPITLIFCYLLLIVLMNSHMKEMGQISSTLATKRQEFLLESITKMRAIRLAGMEDSWQSRYRLISSDAALAAFRTSFAAQVMETGSYVIMSLGGIATLGFGVLAVINQNLTVGALIAAMMVIWRIITPMQVCCASIVRIQHVFTSTRQVERLLNVPPEHEPYAAPAVRPKIGGRVTFNRVTLRYSADTEPSALGLSFEIQPGKIVAIKGGNGSGKSTILKLILGLYQPQSGNVRIDGIDIRQYDPIALRQAISYIPQNVDLFSGTIRENIQFINPLATIEDCRRALEEACALSEIEAMPNGLDTVIGNEGADSIPFMLRQKINLARAYIKPSPIMLFDEASYSLGVENDIAFLKKMESLRGKSTVFLVTHREDHMTMADILMVMQRGELTHAGPPDQVLTILKGRTK